LAYHRKFADTLSKDFIGHAVFPLLLRCASARTKRINSHYIDTQLDGSLQERIQELDDFVQLTSGTWYATTRRLEIYGIYFQNTGKPQRELEHVEVKPLTPSDIPASKFNSEKLLEGAKLETY
jgi:hypothetical protein